ncbi:MAG: hypothetical protein PF518_05745 [Spirochaetaceae bacterium]|nr:hypothetical protein [Spirochaetaceae bacterium]
MEKGILFFITKSRLISAGFFITLLFLFSCPSPLSKLMLLQVQDETSPVITILTPEEGSSYASTVVVTGIVDDSSESSGEKGRINSLSYVVLGTNMERSITLETDGSFTFNFPTTNISGSITIQINASDWNGNVQRASRTLVDQGSITTFSVIPGNEEVTIRWDPVPLSESYTLYYTTNGTYPSEGYGEKLEKISSPFTLKNLQNGSRHIIQLKSESLSGEDNYSNYTAVIPLSGTTLLPYINEEYRKIIVNWNEIDGSEQFEVWRAFEKDGTYLNISGPIQRNSFIDSDVIEDETYYYKIKPGLEDSLKSMASTGKMSPFPPRALALYLSSSDTSNQSFDVRVQGNYAYVADVYGGLRIVDISNPLIPFQVSEYKGSDVDETWSLDISGDYVYLCNGYEPFEILNISDPYNPVLSGKFTDEVYWPNFYAVKIVDDYAYLVSWSEGLWILDISDPASPEVIISNFGADYGAYEIEIIGDYAYIPDTRSDSFYIVNISDPESPIEESIFPLSAIGRNSMAISGNYAYLGDYQIGMKILDITDKSNPFQVPGGIFQHWDDRITDIAIFGNFACMTYLYNGIAIVDVSDPANPIFAGDNSNTNSPLALDAQEGYAYVADDEEGIKIFNVAVPWFPEVVGSYTPLGTIGGELAISDEIACIAQRDLLTILNISSPSNPIVITQINAPTKDFMDVTISGNYIYTMERNDFGSDQFIIRDIIDPTNPKILGSFSSTSGERALIAKGDFVFIADGQDGMLILNVADPITPKLHGVVDLNNAMDVDISGNYAYVADYSEGLKIIDISDSRFPYLVGSYPLIPVGMDSQKVKVSGNYVYLYDKNFGLMIIDVSNPSSPIETTSSPITGVSGGLSISGSYGYIPGSTGELKVMSLFDPTAPVQVGTCQNVDSSYVVTRGGYAYTTGNNTFKVIDLMP